MDRQHFNGPWLYQLWEGQPSLNDRGPVYIESILFDRDNFLTLWKTVFENVFLLLRHFKRLM